MKKVLAMLLVLGLASFANASMSFDLAPTPPGGGHGFSPDDPLLPSEWVELDVVYTGNVPLWATGALTLTITGTGEWSGEDAETYDPPELPIEQAWTYHPKFDPEYKFMGIIAMPGINAISKTADGKTLVVSGATDLNKDIAIAAGEILFDHLNIHCTGPGEIVVTLTTSVSSAAGTPIYWDGDLLTEDLNAVGDSITIYNIPEPMTMALLGIGGLGLIRRRRR